MKIPTLWEPRSQMHSSPTKPRAPRVMLLGYNGANNTGAEALLLADIEDVRAVLGPEAIITVPTLNPQNLRRYVQEGPNLRIAQFPSLFFLELRRLVRQHDLVILVEGSSYMDTWGSALLLAFLWATRCAHNAHVPCLAYAVDAGQLSARNQFLIRREASKTDLIVTRSAAAAQRLRFWGVHAPIESTADNAFTFRPSDADARLLQREWPEAASGVVGLAVVDFFLWPVVMRPWGRTEDCYRWPYYFSRSQDRRRASLELAQNYANLADLIVEEHGRSVALLGMEQVDESLATAIQQRMHHPEKARVFSSRVYDASQMTVLLRGLDLLVTSRYHASVLSLAAAVPQVAVGHDLRLLSLYCELDLADEYFLDRCSPSVFESLRDRVDRLLREPGLQQHKLRQGHEEHLHSAQRNRQLLRSFAASRGFVTTPVLAEKAEVAA